MYIMFPGLVGTSQRAKVLESTSMRHRCETFLSDRRLIEIDPRFFVFLVIISSLMSHTRHSGSVLQQYWCLDSLNFLWSVRWHRHDRSPWWSIRRRFTQGPKYYCDLTLPQGDWPTEDQDCSKLPWLCIPFTHKEVLPCMLLFPARYSVDIRKCLLTSARSHY